MDSPHHFSIRPPAPNGACLGGNLPASPDAAALRGTICDKASLNLDQSIAVSFLPSFAREISLDTLIRSNGAPPQIRKDALILDTGNHRIEAPLHIVAHEVLHHHRTSRCEVFFAFNNSRLFNDLPERTQMFLRGIHETARERGFEAFERKFLRYHEINTIAPLGRLLSGVLGEMSERPLTVVPLEAADDKATRISWCLVDYNEPSGAIALRGSEAERLRFCRDIIEAGFGLARNALGNPVEAFCALGAKLGLVAGQSDAKTVYISAPNTLDITGEKLSLLVRPGPEDGRTPGLTTCWAHHDSMPRPVETRSRS